MSGPFTTSVAQATPFEETSFIPRDNVQEAIEYVYNNAPGLIARFTLTLTHNGVVSNGTFYGYSELISGDDSPIILPFGSKFTDFTFTNKKSGADYTLIFRKGSENATPFLTISKNNTQYFAKNDINEDFAAGEAIYVEHLDDGTNTADVGIVLFFQRL